MKTKPTLRLITASLLTLTTACSTPKTNPGSSTDSAAINTTADAETTGAGQAPSPHRPRALDPEPRLNQGPEPWAYTPISGLSGTGAVGAVVAAAMVGTAMGLSKVFPATKTGSDLVGNCSYGDPDSALLSPCIHATVNLLNESGQIAASASTNRTGDFKFYIPNGQSYYVQVLDKKNRTASTRKKIGSSEFVALFLKP